MKPTLKYCLSKIRLLEGQDFFQRNEIIIGFLAKRIQSVAESEGHVERMIETWICRTRQMLHVSDVPALAYETYGALPAGCDICHGEPVITIEKNGGYSMIRCKCPRGQALTARAKAHQNEPVRAREHREDYAGS